MQFQPQLNFQGFTMGHSLLRKLIPATNGLFGLSVHVLYLRRRVSCETCKIAHSGESAQGSTVDDRFLNNHR